MIRRSDPRLTPQATGRPPQRGFSLLEVLIAVVILAIGLIGIAALQVTTQAYSEASLYRSQAAALAREMVERMRVNFVVTRDPDVGENYNFNSLPTKTQNCDGNVDCNPLQMRDHDIRVWAARVRASLPAATASIATAQGATSDDPVTVTITLGWDASRGQRAAESQPFVFRLTGLSRGS